MEKYEDHDDSGWEGDVSGSSSEDLSTPTTHQLNDLPPPPLDLHLHSPYDSSPFTSPHPLSETMLSLADSLLHFKKRHPTQVLRVALPRKIFFL